MGSFTLEDMLGMLRMVRKMGPMKKVLSMMPGMGNAAQGLDVDDKQMNRIEALFTSMTPRERLEPDILDMSGAGESRQFGAGAGRRQRALEALQGHEEAHEAAQQDGPRLDARREGQARGPRRALAVGGDDRPQGWEGPGMLGGLGGLLGGGGGGMPEMPPGLEGLAGGAGGSAALPDGELVHWGPKGRDRKKEKAKAKQKRKNRKKR